MRLERGSLQAQIDVPASLTFTRSSTGTKGFRASQLPTWRKRKLSKGDAGPPQPNDADKACTAYLTHLPRPATMRGLESSIRPQGVRRCASRFVVSEEHSKAPTTTPLARPKTLVTMPVSGCRRLKLASSSLITPPTWRTDLGDHRDHLEYVLGGRAGHWNDVRATYTGLR